jgi:hypothetical protein
MQRVAALAPSRWPALIGDLNGLAAARHLQAYFNNATVEAEIDRVGWSGSVNPTRAPDYMMEVESNYYGDKANYFVSRHYTLALTLKGHTLEHQVTVDLVNNTPCGSYVRASYNDNVRLYVAGNASSTSDNLAPVRYPNPAAPPGSRLMDGWLHFIPCNGGAGHAVFKYNTPWTVNDNGLDQIYWQKQPGTLGDKIDVSWTYRSGHTYKVGGSLAQDRVIGLTPTGVTLTAGQPAQATLPSLSLG